MNNLNNKKGDTMRDDGVFVEGRKEAHRQCSAILVQVAAIIMCVRVWADKHFHNVH